MASPKCHDIPQVKVARDFFLEAARSYARVMALRGEGCSDDHHSALEGFLDGWEHGGKGVDQQRCETDEQYAYGARAGCNHLVP